MLIRCKLGPQTSHCGGHTYDFAVDGQGRAVAEVHNAAHIRCFLAVEHYEEFQEDAEDIADVQAGDVSESEIGGETPADGGENITVTQPAKRGRKPRN